MVSKISLAAAISSRALSAAANNLSVVLPNAETTTVIFWFLDAFATMANTFCIFLGFATDEPPNFNTYIGYE